MKKLRFSIAQVHRYTFRSNISRYITFIFFPKSHGAYICGLSDCTLPWCYALVDSHGCNTCIHSCKHACMHASIHTSLHPYIPTLLHPYIPTHACMHTSIHPSIYPYIHTYKKIYVYVYIFIGIPSPQCVEYVYIWLGLPHVPWIVNKLGVPFSRLSLPPNGMSDRRTNHPGKSHALRRAAVSIKIGPPMEEFSVGPTEIVVQGGYYGIPFGKLT